MENFLSFSSRMGWKKITTLCDLFDGVWTWCRENGDWEREREREKEKLTVNGCDTVLMLIAWENGRREEVCFWFCLRFEVRVSHFFSVGVARAMHPRFIRNQTMCFWFLFYFLHLFSCFLYWDLGSLISYHSSDDNWWMLNEIILSIN